ncbi:ABC transporter substrate-binding protein [Rickettsiaceae bacterium]|nr:ABC transporter substrate-binding protein [Rickettsiaceae bacterium]
MPSKNLTKDINMSKYKSLLLIILSFVLISCDRQSDENIWIVGTSADNPPYEYMSNGKVIGFDIDFIQEVASHLGKKVEIKNMEFHGLMAALDSNSVDMVVAGMSVTKQRVARVDFSVPYTDAEVAVLHKTGDGVLGGKDLHNKIVGVQLGTIWALIAQDMSIKYNFRVKSLNNNLMLVEELKTGALDAVILEEFQAKEFQAKYPQFSHFQAKQYSSSFAIAMQKNSPLTKSVNHTIQTLKRQNFIEELSKKWGIVGAE